MSEYRIGEVVELDNGKEATIHNLYADGKSALISVVRDDGFADCPIVQTSRFSRIIKTIEQLESELKPCPFCGSTELDNEQNSSGNNVICYRCKTEGPLKATKMEAAEAWNWRTHA